MIGPSFYNVLQLQIQCKDTEIDQTSTELQRRDELLQQKDVELQQKDLQFQQKDEEFQQKAAEYTSSLHRINVHYNHAVLECYNTFVSLIKDLELAHHLKDAHISQLQRQVETIQVQMYNYFSNSNSQPSYRGHTYYNNT